MKKSIILGMLATLFGVSFAQSNPQKSTVELPEDSHGRYIVVTGMLQKSKPDTLAIRQYLEEWEAKDPKNVDLSTCWFNLYLSRSRESILQLTVPNGEGEYEYETDKDSQKIVIKDSLGNVKGYLEPGETIYTDTFFNKAIAKLDEGLALNPNRLDIWMGKIQAYLMKKDYSKACDNIFQTLRRAKVVGNGWLWTEDEPINEKSFEAISNMTDYAVQLMEANKVTEALQVMDSLIAFKPDYSAFKLIKGDICAKKKLDEEALAIYESLWEEYKEDMPYVSNLAWLYSDHDRLEDMERLCQILDKSNDPEYISFARQLRQAHETLNIDFEAIKVYAEQNKKELSQLTERFVKGDETLTLNEISKVYFGHAADPKNCKPLWKEIDAARKLYDEKKYKESFALCESALKKHPVSLAANSFAFLSLRSINEEDERLDIYYSRFMMLVQMIIKGARPLIEDKPDSSLVYSILWRDDENTLVDIVFQEMGIKAKNYIFTNPVYFLQELEKTK